MHRYDNSNLAEPTNLQNPERKLPVKLDHESRNKKLVNKEKIIINISDYKAEKLIKPSISTAFLGSSC